MTPGKGVRQPVGRTGGNAGISGGHVTPTNLTTRAGWTEPICSDDSTVLRPSRLIRSVTTLPVLPVP